MDQAEIRRFAEEILDFEKRLQALYAGTNDEDDEDSLLDDIRVSAVMLAEGIVMPFSTPSTTA